MIADLLTRQAMIPPPVQHDGLVRIFHEPHDDWSVPDQSRSRRGRIKRRLRRVHKQVSGFVMIVGYVTSASAGVGLGLMVIRWLGLI